jgi:hypothetical protein
VAAAEAFVNCFNGRLSSSVFALTMNDDSPGSPGVSLSLRYDAPLDLPGLEVVEANRVCLAEVPQFEPDPPAAEATLEYAQCLAEQGANVMMNGTDIIQFVVVDAPAVTDSACQGSGCVHTWVYPLTPVDQAASEFCRLQVPDYVDPPR